MPRDDDDPIDDDLERPPPQLAAALEHVVVVLVEPQRAINVGTVMRAMKNMGVTRLRLVRPAEMSLERTQIAAHRTEDILDATRFFEDLGEALADCHHVVGLTARLRRGGWTTRAPRERASSLLARAASGQRLALVFGRESSGLTNAELDRCDELLTIPTQPDYSSLNLSQAVLLTCHELWLAAHAVPSPHAPSPTPGDDLVTDPAATADRDRLFAQIEHTLSAIGFFKSGNSVHVMRALRRLLLRAQPDAREVRTLTGVFVEVLKFAHLIRRGIIPAGLPPHSVDLGAHPQASDVMETPDEEPTSS